MDTTRICVIACEVLRLEVEHLCPPGTLRIYLDQNLHDTPDTLRRKLQETVTQTEEEFPELEALALAYGLCSKAVEGVRARRCRIAIPRAHDCITLLLGDKKAYAEYVAQNPGTYWYSPGWIATDAQPGPERYERAYQKYLEKFDEDDARYLMETEQAWMKEYTRACYVDLGVGDREKGLAYTKACAEWLQWEQDTRDGDPSLLSDLLRGNWDDERFLVLEPGQAAVQSVDDRILKIAER